MADVERSHLIYLEIFRSSHEGRFT